MSVLTASSSIPSVAFAADMFSDGSAAEYVAEDAAVFTEEPTYAEEPVEADTEDISLQAVVEIAGYKRNWLYGVDEAKNNKVEVYAVDEAGKKIDSVESKYYDVTITDATADCVATPKVTLTATIDGQTYTAQADKGNWVGGVWTLVTPAKHDFVATGEPYYEGTPVCGAEVTLYQNFKCSKCNKTEKRIVGTTTISHNWEKTPRYYGCDVNGNKTTDPAVANVKLDAKGNVVFENGQAVLVDKTMDGYYYEVICCSIDGTEDSTTVKKHTVEASEAVYTKATIKADGMKNIAKSSQAALVNGTYEVTDFPLNEKETAKILFEKCEESASYTVTYETETGKNVDVTYTIEASATNPHHVAEIPTADTAEKYLKFASASDKACCTITVDKDSNIIVTNNSCSGTITYTETTVCAACKKVISSVQKTAEAKGVHAIDSALKAEIVAASKAGTLRYEDLTAYVKNKKKIQLTNDTSTCEKAGTVTVQFICMKCNEIGEEVTVNIPAKEHKAQTTKMENYVAPTCTAKGSYDRVVYCDYCGKVLSTTKVSVDKLDHKKAENDKNAQVAFNGDLVIDEGWVNIAQYAGKEANVLGMLNKLYYSDVKAEAYVLCETCGEYKDTSAINMNNLKVTVDEVKKEGKTCEPGYITLTATYTKTAKDVAGEKVVVTKTFEYYSSETAYTGRTAHDPDQPVKENIVEATATENGSYDEVIYCKVCGTEISRKHVIVNATGEVVLPAVTGLTAKATGMNRVALSWDAVEGAEGYFVIGFGENRTGSQIAYTTRTSWTDTAADSDAFNFYWVQPFNRNAAGKIVKGELGGYKYALGRVVAATGKVFATATEDGIELSWAAVNGANSYVVMSKTGSADAAFNASVATDTTTFVDTNAAAGEVTYYWVYATYKNADGKVLAAGKTSPFAWAIAK